MWFLCHKNAGETYTEASLMMHNAHVPEVLDMLRDPDKFHGVLESIAVDVCLSGRTPVDVCSDISIQTLPSHS